jgi:hypothetical protein
VKTIEIVRFLDTGKATFGRLTVFDEAPGTVFGEVLYRCYSLELPWYQNRPNISCIPAGSYRATLGTFKGSYPNYELHDVPERSAIEFHRANYTRELRGCIAPGERIEVERGEPPFICVTSSKVAHDRVMAACGGGAEVRFVIEYLDNEVRQ